MKKVFPSLIALTLLTTGHSVASVWISPVFKNVGSMSAPSYIFEEQGVADMSSWGAATMAFVGYNSMGIFGIDGGSKFAGSPNSLVVGEGANGVMSVEGAGSEYNISANSSLSVGGIIGSGTGSLGVYDGGFIDVTTFSAGNKGTGYVTIDGAGSVMDALQVIVGGSSGGVGEVVISNGGKLIVGNSGLTMNEAGGAGTSFINLGEDAMLQLYGSYANLDSFLGSVGGTAAINYWNGSEYVDITTGTEGVDYILTQSDYTTTLQQIPEPSSVALIGLAGIGMFVYRRFYKICG